jgi:hypothetical protein
MKNIYKLNSFLIISIGCIVLGFSSCKTALVPQYVKLENVSKLKTGMDKKQVLSSLENVYPTEILNGTGDCEIHEYLYVKPHRSLLNLTGVLKREELTSGNQKYVKENKAVLVFRNSKLATVYSKGGSENMASLLAVQNALSIECENETKVTKGCMDPMSLSYDPDALEDDGSCEYCDCGMVPNPVYNEKRPISKCNTRCISEDKVDENGKLIKKAEENSNKTCNECDLIDAIKGSGASVNIELNMD